MADNGDNGLRKDRERWALTKEKVLMYSGLGLIASQVILRAVGSGWSYQFVLAGLALCGVAITQWGEKK